MTERRVQATVENVVEGSVVEADDGFTCIAAGKRLMVKKDSTGFLYVECDGGEQEETHPVHDEPKHHYIDGQIDEEDEFAYVGLTLIEQVPE